jgi:polyisoprenoid-binding protein YceI
MKLLAAILVALALPAAAEVETYTIDPNHTFPAFEIGHFGYSIQRGRFNKTAGKATLDPAAHTGSVEIVIDAASVDTGHVKLGEHLRSPDFFNVERFPTLAFKGSQLTFDGDNVKSVTGELTLLGVARPVTLNAVQFRCAPHPVLKRKVCGGDFVATIKRSDFGMTKYLPALADDVTLRINFEAIKDS